jgi:uncharacterized protein YkwD
MKFFRKKTENKGFFKSVTRLLIFFRFKNFKKYSKEQAREIDELKSGKQSFGRFLKDSKNLVGDFLIPNDRNNHKPFAIRTKTLITYFLIAVGVKVLVTGFLFATYPTPAQLSAIISSNVIELLNQSRVEENLPPLKNQPVLEKYAYQKAIDMVARNYFSHDTPEGKKPWHWINKNDYDYVFAGENLAMGFTTAEMVHEAFMNSPSHRKNIMNEKYQDVGIAVVHGEIEGKKTILLVQFFGTQRRDLDSLVLNSENKPNAGLADTEISLDAESEKVVAGVEQDETFAAGSLMVYSASPNKELVDLVVEYTNIFFLALLLFIFIAFILNVFVKIKVQHPSLIIQGLVVIVLVASLAFSKFHFIEHVAMQSLVF